MIELPWPASVLSPNSRSHWGAKVAPTRKHREWARNATLAAKPVVPESGPIGVLVMAYPRSRRAMDRDNLLSSCKAYFDGMADALKVNDRRFDPRLQWGDPVKGGRIVITVIDPFNIEHLHRIAGGPLMDANKLYLPAGKVPLEEAMARGMAR